MSKSFLGYNLQCLLWCFDTFSEPRREFLESKSNFFVRTPTLQPLLRYKYGKQHKIRQSVCKMFWECHPFILKREKYLPFYSLTSPSDTTPSSRSLCRSPGVYVVYPSNTVRNLKKFFTVNVYGDPKMWHMLFNRLIGSNKDHGSIYKFFTKILSVNITSSRTVPYRPVTSFVLNYTYRSICKKWFLKIDVFVCKWHFLKLTSLFILLLFYRRQSGWFLFVTSRLRIGGLKISVLAIFWTSECNSKTCKKSRFIDSPLLCKRKKLDVV